MNPGEVRQLLQERVAAVSFQPLDPTAIIEAGVRRRRRRKVAGSTALGFVVVAAIVTGVTLGGGSTSADRPATLLPTTVPTTLPTTLPATPSPTASPSATTLPAVSRPPLPAGWTALPAPPVAVDQGLGPAVARVGNQIAYWGGEIGQDGSSYSNRGAVLDPTARRWSAMTASPLEGRGLAASAGSDHFFFVWGGSGDAGNPYGDGATYDLTTKQWRKTAAAPLSPRRPLGAAWTGSEFVVIGGADYPKYLVDSAAYNPATDTWRKLPNLGSELTSATVLQVGNQTVVIGTDARPNAFGSNFMFVLSPGDSAWRAYAPPENMESATLTATTDGSTIFAAARPQNLQAPAPEALLVMAFSFATGGWQNLQNPFNPPECYPSLAATSRGVWEFGCTASRFDRATQTWRQLSLPGGSPIVVGGQIVMSGYAIGLDT